MTLEMNRLSEILKLLCVDVRCKLLDNGPIAIAVLVVEQVKPSIEAVQYYQSSTLSDRFVVATHNKSPMKSNLQEKKCSMGSNMRGGM